METTEKHVGRTRLRVVGQDALHALDAELDAELRAFEAQERERLGVKERGTAWKDTMLTPKVARRERDSVTLLIAGLTAAQDKLVEGVLRGLGYSVEYIGMPDNAGLQVGKEFGNRGQCNPTYFTVGNLVKHLIHLRDDKGLTAEEINTRYVFLTAGACGPCRFGMYVTEYRKALRDAGFEGFRVMLFQQQGGLSQASGDDAGIEFSPKFFVGILKSILMGDALNAVSYRIRPYEVEPGATDRAVNQAKEILYEALRTETNIVAALLKCRRVFASVKVDWLRAKPRVSIIGEFWAMTTEGDGNYHLQRFIEKEGGENDIQLVTNVLLYNIWEHNHDTSERVDLRYDDNGRYGLEGSGSFGVTKKMATMRVANAALRSGFHFFAKLLGLHGYKLPNMDEIADVAKDYYNNDLRGGEGHMEVGKLIVNASHAKSHMTLSVKPFGCMPSSGVSDGVQTLVQARYPGAIYCPVETSGDGATNFYSRVQMYLYKARLAAQEELDRAYAETGLTEAQVRAFLASSKTHSSALYHPTHRVAGTAANVVYEVAPLILQSRTRRLVGKVSSVAQGAKRWALQAPGAVANAWAFMKRPETRVRLQEDLSIVREALAGQLDARLKPLLASLVGKEMNRT